jgi:hypothetical protein
MGQVFFRVTAGPMRPAFSFAQFADLLARNAFA